MHDLRMLTGAGLLTAGLAAAVLAGAGAAAADDGSDAGGAGESSSSTKPADTSTKQVAKQPDSVQTPKGEPENVDTDAPDAEDSDTEIAEGTPKKKPAEKRDRDPKPEAERDAEPAARDEPAMRDEPAATPAETPTRVAEEPESTNVVDAFTPAGVPDGPAAQPQLWTAAAAARREIETAFAAPSLAPPAAAATPARLTYTAPPSLQDQISGLVLTSFQVISKITGINVTAVLGGLMASEDPPGFLTYGLNASTSTFAAADGAQWKVWEIASAQPSGKAVVAFHGGGWILQPNILNWIDYTTMARETGATVVVPLYPLATTEAGAAVNVVPAAADVISRQIALNGAENVSVYADSAGSSMALSAVRELIRADKPLPSSIVVLSGAMDMTTSNPDIAGIDDPFFDISDLSAWGSHWTDGVDRRDPLVSPLFFETDVLQKLPPTTIYVGEREIVYPDTLLMYQRAVDEGAPISVVVGTGLPHDWPSSGLPVYTATATVRPDVYRQLGLATPPAVPSLVSVLGTLAWRVFDTFGRLIGGPPSVPREVPTAG